MFLSVLAFGIGTPEIVVIIVLAVLLFGVAKLPQLGTAISQGILNFKRGMREIEAEDEKAKQEKADRDNQADSQTTEDKTSESSKS